MQNKATEYQTMKQQATTRQQVKPQGMKHQRVLLGRAAFWLFAMLALGLTNLGCQGSADQSNQGGQPSAEDTTPSVADDANPAPPPAESVSGNQGSSASPVGGDDPNQPLQFQLTEEERSRPGADAPLPDFGSVGGSIANSVPESFKSGPVGSLGGALYKGVLGAGVGSNDKPALDAPN